MAKKRGVVKDIFGRGQKSKVGMEIARKFVIPFAKQYRGYGQALDDILGAFFNTDTRKISTVYAKRDFVMPGTYKPLGATWSVNHVTQERRLDGPRKISKGTELLVVADRNK